MRFLLQVRKRALGTRTLGRPESHLLRAFEACMHLPAPE
jgi:hypothetical protein